MRLRFGALWNLPSRRFILEALEERIVLDAGVPDVPQDHHDAPNPVEQGHGPTEPVAQAAATPTPPESPSSSADPLDAMYDKPLDVVLISGGIGEIEHIKDAAAPGAKVVVYDAYKDGLTDVVSELTALAHDTGKKIGTLAVISHGEPGAFMLGTSAVSFETLFKYEGAFQTLAQTLAPGAQIQLYGCSTAWGENGEALLERLAGLTGATVFASVDDTGGHDADWTLEYRTDDRTAFHSLLNDAALTDLNTELIFPGRPPLDENATKFYTYYGILDASDPVARYSPYGGVTRYAEVWNFTVPAGGAYVSIGMQTVYPELVHGDTDFVDAWVYLYSGADPATGTLLYQRDDFQGGSWVDSVDPPRAKYCDSLVRGDDPDGNGQYDIFLAEGTYSIEATAWTGTGYEATRFGPYYLVSTVQLYPGFHFEGLGYLPKPDAWRGEGTTQIALGDMDNDGDNDAVAANWGALWDTSTVYEVGQQNRLFLNDGSGTFTYFGQFGDGPSFNGDIANYYTGVTKAVALGDIDRDGDIDVVEGNLGHPAVGEANRYYLNQGTSGGVWQGLDTGIDLVSATPTYEILPTTSIALVDLNRDGWLDITAGNLGYNVRYMNLGADFSGWLGFGSAQRIRADADYSSTITLADINADTYPDLVVGNVSYDPVTGNVTGAINKVYLGLASGNFRAARLVGTDADVTTSVDLADINDDGLLDLIVGNDGISKVYLNQGGSGTSWLGFGAGTPISPTSANTRDIGVMDMNGDGLTDYLVLVNDGQAERVYKNHLGRFTEVYDLGTAGPYTRYGAVGDVDGDGLPDVVIVNDGQLSETYLYKTGPAPAAAGGSGPPVTQLSGGISFGFGEYPVAAATTSFSLLSMGGLNADYGLSPAFLPTTEPVVLEQTPAPGTALPGAAASVSPESVPGAQPSNLASESAAVGDHGASEPTGPPAPLGANAPTAPSLTSPTFTGLTGLEGYASAVAKGQALVFNLSEINAMDWLMGTGADASVASSPDAALGKAENEGVQQPLALTFDMRGASFLDWA
jgi:hypothetical protein